jgi:putative hemolysin
VGERFTYHGWQFVVATKEGARIDRVRMTRLKSTAPGLPDGAPRDGSTPPKEDGQAGPARPPPDAEGPSSDAKG